MKLFPEAIFEQHIIALGKTGAGKSSAIRLIVEHLLNKGSRVVIVTPKADWWGLKLAADGKHAGYPVVVFGGEHSDMPLHHLSGKTMAELLGTGNRSAVLQMRDFTSGQLTQFWIDFASTLFRLIQGKMYLVIDEVHNLAAKGKVLSVQAGEMLHWSNKMASEARGLGITLIGASQRAAKVHNDFLTSCETLMAMRVTTEWDRQAITDWIKGCGSKQHADEILNGLAQMKRGSAWVWSPEVGFGPKQIHFPMFSTYDSFRPQSAGEVAKLKGWADVDLGEVKKKLESVVKEAEANDPSKLKTRIRELEKEVAKNPGKPKEIKVVDKKAITTAVRPFVEALEEAMRIIVKVNAIGFENASLNPDEIQKALKETAKEIHRATQQKIGQRNAEFERLKREANRILQKVNKLLSAEDVTVNIDLQRQEAYTAKSTPVKDVILAKAPNHVPVLNGDLDGPEQKILIALAQLRSIGKDQPPKTMVAGWAGYSPTGGGFANPLGRLNKQKRYVCYPTPGTVQLTSEGIAVIGEHSAPDRQEILNRIRNICDGPECKILDVVLRHGKISKSQLAEEAGYVEKSGGFNNPLGRLRTKGFLDYPQPGMVQAAEWLFA